MQNREIKIGNVIISDKRPVVVIPEGCDNHNGSLDKAKALAYAAKEAGAEIIKFQLHLPDEEMDRKSIKETSSEMFSKWGDLYGFIEQNLLSVENHAKLIAYCKEIGIQYFCTPFSSKAAAILKEIGGDAGYKIGSGETEDLPMIEDVAAYKKPMIVSTGMSTVDEIDLSVNAIKAVKTPLALAHCVSAYPPKQIKDLHLGVIGMLRQRYDVPVGLSDHTPPEGMEVEGISISENEIMWGAIGQGACFVEKHFTLDRDAPDADSRFSHNPKTLKRLIQSLKMIEQAFDDTREVYECEKDVWTWAKRSIFAREDIPERALITRAMLTSKRPSTGIRSKGYKAILGKKTKVAIKKNSMFRLEYFE